MNGPVDISPDHLKVVKEILRENLPDGVAVWVFGSRAGWTTGDSSDLDLALDGGIDHDAMLALEIAFEESSLPYTVDVIDLDRVSDSFRRIVNAQKIPLDYTHKTKNSADRWPSLQFGDCAELVRDTVLPAGLGDTPYIRLEHMGEGALSIIGCGDASDASGIVGRFRRGDILFGKLRPHKIARADFDGVCSTDILVVRPTARTDADFLFYLMASKEFIDAATRGSDAKISRAEWDRISQYEIPVPPLDDQRAIAHILRALYGKVELNRQMSQTLLEMARALFKSWFVDFDPVRARMSGQKIHLSEDLWSPFPDSLVDSELGPIPKGWEVKRLGDVTEIVGGSTPNTSMKECWEGGIHCWATPNDLSILSSPVLLDAERKVTDADLRKTGSGLLPPGTLLLPSGGPIGHLAISEMPIAIGRGLIAMPPCDSISNLFLLFWCRFFHENMMNHADGSTLPEIGKANLKNMPLLVPGAAILTAFKRLTDPWYKRIVANERESCSLIKQRDTLLPRLMSGEAKPKGCEPQAGGRTGRSI